MARRDDLEDNSAFWADLENQALKKSYLMEKWNCSSSFIVVRRQKLAKTGVIGRVTSDGLTDGKYTPTEDFRVASGTKVPATPIGKHTARESFNQDNKGNVTIEKSADRIIPLDEWLDDLRSRGFDPEQFTYSFGHSVWQQTEDVTLYANRFSATKKAPAKDGFSRVGHEAVLEAARNFTYVPEVRECHPRSLVILATDLQTGKTDAAGGHLETINQCLHSFARAAEFVRENPVQEICIVDAGDIVENTFNTPEQIATNSLDLPHQIVEAAYIMQRGIQMLAPLAPSIRYAAVSSNHGQYRTGFKQAGGNAHADFGIAVAKLLKNAFGLNPESYGHVAVQTPEPYMESLSFETSGTKIGVVHGHQASSADKIGDWWKGQSHGRLPTADCDHLTVGHWHSARVQQSGDARWIFVGSASDRGSSWFTNLKGEQSQSGMLTYTTANGDWADLRII